MERKEVGREDEILQRPSYGHEWKGQRGRGRERDARAHMWPVRAKLADSSSAPASESKTQTDGALPGRHVGGNTCAVVCVCVCLRTQMVSMLVECVCVCVCE